MDNIKIMGHGICLPKNKVDNNMLAPIWNVTEEYIYKRSGIKTRYFAVDETIESLASKAGENAINKANIKKDDIDLIIVATTSSFHSMPGISYLVQSALHIENCICLDILAGCSGYINALDIARAYISLGKAQKALVIGVDVLSKCMKKEDISVGFILADGAGATIVEKSKKLYNSYIESNGKDGNILTYKIGENIKMDGTKIYKYAVTKTIENIEKLLEQSKESIDNIKYIIPHQSNKKIMSKITSKLKISEDKVYKNIENIGNTFCASIPIALYEMQEKNLLKEGDKIILLGYGGGLNTGSILLEV